MKTIFKVSYFSIHKDIRYYHNSFDTYEDAVLFIKDLPIGEYQVNKFFVIE